MSDRFRAANSKLLVAGVGRSAPDRAPTGSYGHTSVCCLFSDFKRIVNLNPKVADGTLEFSVPKQ